METTVSSHPRHALIDIITGAIEVHAIYTDLQELQNQSQFAQIQVMSGNISYIKELMIIQHKAHELLSLYECEKHKIGHLLTVLYN
jgi:hypothetical protein